MIIPFSDTASFSQQIVLDDEIFNMTINYNSSFDFWTMDLFDVNNNEIFTNAKLTTGVSIGKRLGKINQPKGDFVVIFDIGGTPARKDFNQNASLVYVPAV